MKLIIAIIAMLMTASAFAEDQSNGCGWGWKVTSKYSFSASTTRATTNSYTMPFGMTSGTAGCAKHSIAKQEQQIKNFVHTSYDSLSLDVATGGGEHLMALTQLLGCTSASQGVVGGKMQSQYQSLFPANGSSDQFIDDMYYMIGHDAQLNQSCRPHTDS